LRFSVPLMNIPKTFGIGGPTTTQTKVVSCIGFGIVN
jgi:hypothetical protein